VDGLVSLLIFAVLFYVMMRFGCGAHMVHGHGEHDGGKGHGDSQHTDPVCGKHVPTLEGYGKMHNAQPYRFCSRECLDAFEADPQRYTGVPG
jgi:YHS domain-containing protein